MAPVQNRDVFEFCEKLYNHLHKQDNGYYPHKHDPVVFQSASEKFDISVENAEKAFRSYKKIAANIEMMRINRLPKKKKQATLMKKMQDIVRNNKDLPFHILEGEPSEPLPMAMDLIEEEFSKPIENLAQYGWAIPLSINLEQLEQLKSHVTSQRDIDAFFEKYYSDQELKRLFQTISESLSNAGQQQRFNECCIVFKQGLYSICLTALITILEGKISSFGNDPTDVRVMRVCNFHAEEERKNDNKIKALCWKSIYEYTKILFVKSDFSQSEPSETNRHWLIHGRTGQIGEKIDCIRLFNALLILSTLD